MNIIFLIRGIAELPENEVGQGFDTEEFNSSYPSTKLTLGLGKIVNITAQALSDWTGKDSTHLSLKSGDIVEVTENQVCIYDYIVIIENYSRVSIVWTLK